jgi:hypothetical protein
MPIVRDFRNFAFQPRRIDRCGRFIGRQVYWKLYAVENLLRLFIHSVLSAQISPQWWSVAVDPKVRRRADNVRQQYLRRPHHTLPGTHDIYYVFLSDLGNIIRANSNLFLPFLPDVDQWMLKIEAVRIPRNVVGHMNFPNQPDRQRVDAMYKEFSALVTRLQQSGLVVRIPS